MTSQTAWQDSAPPGWSQRGRNILVTGGSAGIGLGISRAFVQRGGNALIVGRDQARLDEALADLRRLAGPDQTIAGYQADMAKPEDIEGMFAELPSLLPALDVFVANAGFGTVVPFLDLDLDEWQRIIDLNLTGVFLGCRNAGRVMRDSGRPDASIVAVSSIRGLGARPGRIAYSATKAALNHFVRVAAYELAQYKIRVNAVLPGITETPLALSNPGPFAEAIKTVPFGRAATIEEIGEATMFLASSQSSFVTGALLVVDGGESLF